MDVRILGPLAVLDDAGRPLALGGEKQRAVLALLVLQVNQVVATEALIDGVWGEATPDSAPNVVQAYVSRLRKVLATGGAPADAVIARQGAGYVLRLAAESVDLCEFERLSRAGRAALDADPQAARTLLDRALGCWHGSALAEFRDMPFAHTELPRLRELRLATLTARLDADLALGRHSELVGELETLVAEHPLHEHLHARLALSLYRAGRQAQALEALRRVRTVLADDLGIDPGRPLQDLEAGVLAQDPALDWRPPAPVPSGADADLPDEPTAGLPAGPPAGPDPSAVPTATPVRPPAARRRAAVWNLPPRNSRFTGRVAELAAVADGLRPPLGAPGVCAIYGLGGVGKTQLAIEYAHRFADRYGIVWWVDAQTPVLIPDQLTALAARLGLSTAGAAGDTVDRLLTALADRSDWLIVFDNADRPSDLAHYRPAGPGSLLVTSRFPGWSALGTRVQLDVLSRQDTVSLLQAQLPALDDAVGDQLAAELGDLPLAAAQAAAYLEQNDMDPAEYLRRFRSRRAALLTGGTVLGYQGRVDTTWDISLERLSVDSPAAVRLLELASFLAPDAIPLRIFTDHPDLLDDVFRAGGSDPDAVADAVSDAVGAAVGYSLVRRRSDGFQQHRLLQAVIRHALPAERRDQLAATVVQLLTAAHPGDPNDPVSWADYAQLAPHVLALGDLVDATQAGRTLLLDTVTFLSLRGDTRAGRYIAEELVARWRVVLGADAPDTLTAVANLTSALTWLSEHDRVRTLGQDALARAQRVLGPEHPVSLRLAMNLTFALAWVGEAATASAIGLENLDRSRRVLGAESADAIRLAANLTLALTLSGEPEQGRELGAQTVDRARRALGPDHPVTLVAASHLGLAMAWLGVADLEPGEPADVFRRSRQALGPDHPTTLAAGSRLCFLLIRTGDRKGAVELGEEIVSGSRRALGPDHLITWVCEAVLALALADQDPLRAHELATAVSGRTRAALGPDHLITLLADAATGSALTVIGDAGGARRVREEAGARARRHLGPDHVVTGLFTAGSPETEDTAGQAPVAR